MVRVLTTAAAWFLITSVPGSGFGKGASSTFKGFAFSDTIHAARLVILLVYTMDGGRGAEIDMKGVFRNRSCCQTPAPVQHINQLLGKKIKVLHVNWQRRIP